MLCSKAWHRAGRSPKAWRVCSFGPRERHQLHQLPGWDFNPILLRILIWARGHVERLELNNCDFRGPRTDGRVLIGRLEPDGWVES